MSRYLFFPSYRTTPPAALRVRTAPLTHHNPLPPKPDIHLPTLLSSYMRIHAQRPRRSTPRSPTSRPRAPKSSASPGYVCVLILTCVCCVFNAWCGEEKSGRVGSPESAACVSSAPSHSQQQRTQNPFPHLTHPNPSIHRHIQDEDHQTFIEKYGFQLNLLSDVGGAVRKQYEVPPSLFGALDGRVTYVVGKDGACGCLCFR